MRARNIKPGFFTNDLLAELPMPARLLFIGLWCLADREGRLEDRPRKIRAELFPYDDIDADALLASLAQGKDPFIVRYTANEVKCIQITGFSRHQKPHPNELPSRLPACPALVGSTSHLGKKSVRPGRKVRSTQVRIAPASSLNEESMNEECGKDDSSTRSSTATPPAIRYGEFENVVLTKAEHSKLVERFGVERTEELIGRLSGYMASKGKRYRSHYATIVNWARREVAAEPKSEFDFGGLER